jgi:hypothetical protein
MSATRRAVEYPRLPSDNTVARSSQCRPEASKSYTDVTVRAGTTYYQIVTAVDGQWRAILRRCYNCGSSTVNPSTRRVKNLASPAISPQP